MTNDNFNYEQDIPIFFSVGDKFCSICSVALISLMENANPKNHYSIYILTSGMNEVNRQKLQSSLFPNFSLEFVDVTERLKEYEEKFPIRDYYNNYTYYRLFIPSFFPNLEKALYLDSDIIVLGDVSELYNVDMGDNLVAAVPDGAVRNTPIFQVYVEKALGVDREMYFNAGVLLMNLKAMREFDFENKFLDLCEKYKFKVAQDQDYLNVLCKNRVKILPFDWDMMPFPNSACKYDELKLVHYNLMFKPWDMHDVLFEEYFWKYAEKSPFYLTIDEMRKNIPEDAADAPKKLLGGMTALCNEEIEKENNYNREHEKLFL